MGELATTWSVLNVFILIFLLLGVAIGFYIYGWKDGSRETRRWVEAEFWLKMIQDREQCEVKMVELKGRIRDLRSAEEKLLDLIRENEPRQGQA